MQISFSEGVLCPNNFDTKLIADLVTEYVIFKVEKDSFVHKIYQSISLLPPKIYLKSLKLDDLLHFGILPSICFQYDGNFVI